MVSFSKILNYVVLVSLPLTSASPTPGVFDSLFVDANYNPLVPHPMIQLDYGMFLGNFLNNMRTAQFLGIPYAMPPIGDNRFRPPQPPISIGAGMVYNSTVHGSACMQNPLSTGFTSSTLKMSENCLNLDVYLPVQYNGVYSSGLPVVVYFYGGDFDHGHNSQPYYNGDSFLQAQATDRQVIIVVPNYRTNVFGFMASQELASEGSLNPGLLDQVAALKWVKKYIKGFGGNPNNVVAWGHSAGATSISLHLMGNGGNSSYFNRMILQSGGMASVLNTPKLVQPDFTKLATAVGCNTTATTTTMACMRNVDANVLSNAANNLNFRYYPVVDGQYLIEQPSSALAAQRVRKIDSVITTVTNEGTRFAIDSSVSNIKSDSTYRRGSVSFLNTSSSNAFDLYYPASANSSALKITSDSYGDSEYNAPAFQLAQYLVSGSNPVAVYKGRFNIKPSIVANQRYKAIGVFHESDLPFMWAYSPELSSTNLEQTVSNALIIGMIDFICSIAPRLALSNIPSNISSYNWPQYTASNPTQVVWQTEAPIIQETTATSTIAKYNFWFGVYAYVATLLA
ncbi:hypothetical protein QVD99_004537 [Batrachochytrium dendrobatidis]|uniref:Carboxylesterase type B domain-containing protein n=1 Tax=Batrachochytrium dendrobatidis (strain JEL423) TaxID=403673 RepID=A0A177WNF8_BATDL|nr:hypothetical protein O5D80_002774 [Batrachochytrium dendrobatidis]KAK5668743.1 hypothetical protein QVD99_004537 [Batrachochytrium dendrobatidis]OAJ41649.1 hypothetical protein BDEG_25218 [Batrachochytrium dendrobatidis JEL423]